MAGILTDSVCPSAQRTPRKRPTCGHFAWPRVLLCSMALATLLASSASPQYLEAVIRLPDTLGPLNGPYHLAWDENPAHPRLYIGGEGDSGGVIVAQALTCERMARISTGPVKALCFVAPHAKLYVANARSDSIKVVDCATNQVTSTVCVAGEAPVLQYNHLNDRLYCGGSSISVIDCAADTVIHTIAVAANVLALDSADNKLFVGSDGRLAVIDCGPDSVAAVLPRIDSVGALCYNPTAGKVYATSGDTLYAVRTQDDSLVAARYFGGLVQMLACDPASNRIYFVDGISWEYLQIVDCASDSAVLRADIGMYPYSLACNAARNVVYFVSGGHVYVLDGTTGQAVASVLTQSGEGCVWSPGLDRVICPPGLNEYPPSQQCLLTAVDGSGDTLAGFLPLTTYASSITLDTVHNRLHFVYPSVSLGCVGAVDCSRNVVTWYKLVHWAEAVCYNPNNDQLYYGVYDCDADTSVVVVYDCAAREIVKRIPVNGLVHAFRLHVALNKLYAETYGGGLYTIDCSHDSIRSYIPWPDMYPGFQFLVPEDNTYWYLGPAYTMEVDCLGDTVIALVVNHLTTVNEACACPNVRSIYTGSGYVFNMDKPAEVDTIPYGADRFLYLPNAHKLYACSNDKYHTTFRVLDTRADTAIATFGSPCQVSGMILDHTGQYIYCAGYEDSLVPVIDTRKDSVMARIRVSTYAAARDPMALNRSTNRIYEAQYSQYDGSSIPVLRDSILVGLEETSQSCPVSYVGSTVVRRGAPMRISAAGELWDASGRRAANLKPGPNNISHLAPGVYFLRGPGTEDGRPTAAVRKVMIAE
jgi:YVTN family beta-propeller protein